MSEVGGIMGRMPEMPEVQALAMFLATRLRGVSITRVDLAAISALKTFDPPLEAIRGSVVRDVTRHGKFVDISLFSPDEDLHVVFHLAKAGWLRFAEQISPTIIKPGKTPIALRVVFSDDSGFDLTEAGTKKSLAVYVVRDAQVVPGISTLGPDPLADDFTRESFADILRGRRTQIKGVLRDQSLIGGIGNAYSDEILHAARLSPYASAAALSDDDITTLYTAMKDTLRHAIEHASGKPPAELKDAKRAGFAVHARTGHPCPVCGVTVRSVYFADRSLEYCPTCQTGGKILADRRRSRLLK
ncbi:Fpg/Nei family DNA glycosylase [Microbacterium mitrae]